MISLKHSLDTKVKDHKDLMKTGIPYLGEIPLSSSKEVGLLRENDKSVLAEAYRYIRTNINFLLDSDHSGKIIFVTSTHSGEGKTYTSINLASSLVQSGKKVVLIGMDLRAPKMKTYLDVNKGVSGLTNYIKDRSLSLDNVILVDQSKFQFDIIPSGDIPPNPVELLMNDRVGDMFEQLKEKYDHIIVDTAPVGQVTDTIQISGFADLTIYVVKANYLDKRLLSIPETLNSERRLNNMTFLINGALNSRGSYGYGYKYGYGEEKRTIGSKNMFPSGSPKHLISGLQC